MDNKTIVETLSARMDLSRETIEMLIEGLSNIMKDCGKQLDSISIAGFGNFEAKKRNERVAVHPATGKRLLVPPKISYSFKASSNLKEKVNNG